MTAPETPVVGLVPGTPGQAAPGRIPAAVWALGFVSMMMDISSEMVHGLLPGYMVGALGASVLMVGMVEGIAEFTAMAAKVFSGTLSDYLGRRKGLVLFGYGLGALSKPLVALAPGPAWVLGARFVDRAGKGLRGAPRDALVADITPPALRGAAFGLRQSLDTVGAFVGPALAVALMLLSGGDTRFVLGLAVVPAVLAVALLAFGVREPAGRVAKPKSNPLTMANLRRLGAPYWRIVAIAAVFNLARFSEAFLVLQAPRVGLSGTWAPLVLIAMNMVYAVSAYPFGRISDRVSHRWILVAGLAVLVAADILLAISRHWTVAFAGIALWGLHMGMTQGLLAAMVAKAAPADLRGTAFGIMYLGAGVAMLLASLCAGYLWQRFGPPWTFAAGACFAMLAMVLIATVRGTPRPGPETEAWLDAGGGGA